LFFLRLLHGGVNTGIALLVGFTSGLGTGFCTGLSTSLRRCLRLGGEGAVGVDRPQVTEHSGVWIFAFGHGLNCTRAAVVVDRGQSWVVPGGLQTLLQVLNTSLNVLVEVGELFLVVAHASAGAGHDLHHSDLARRSSGRIRAKATFLISNGHGQRRIDASTLGSLGHLLRVGGLFFVEFVDEIQHGVSLLLL